MQLSHKTEQDVRARRNGNRAETLERLVAYRKTTLQVKSKNAYPMHPFVSNVERGNERARVPLSARAEAAGGKLKDLAAAGAADV